MAVILFIPVITQLVVVVVVVVVIIIIYFCYQGCTNYCIRQCCYIFLYWRPNPENITCSFHLNQRQEFYISMYLRTLQISKKLCTMYG